MIDRIFLVIFLIRFTFSMFFSVISTTKQNVTSTHASHMASNSKPFKAAYVLLASFVTSVFVAVQAMLQISSLLLSLMT